MPNITQHNPASPLVETIKVKVDGREMEAPKTMPDWQGKPQPTTMLQACALAGVEVPHYCYHPKLPVAGNCRMCLVEFGTPALGPDRKPVLNPDGTPKIIRSVLPYEPGTPRGAIACATPISPGMEIYPGSPATRQMREAVLESLLINHPLDCPICDQAGECKLQEYSVEYGQAASRFAEEKVHKPKQVDLGPRIVLDDERCILCSRCIRFTRDIAGDDALGFTERGSHTTLTRFPGKKFDNNYTLNTVDICPVGALTSQGFSISNARLVPQGKQERLRQLRHRLQHRHRLPRGQGLSFRAARERRRQLLLDVRLRPAQLQMDQPRRPAHPGRKAPN